MSHPLKIAQISDTHLFSDKRALHCGADVYQNLVNVLSHIKLVEQPDVIVFTGDLTQDHSDASYQLFVDIIQQLKIIIPVHFIPGNHDEVQQLEHYLMGAPFDPSKIISNDFWQLLLINSKGDTPSGYVSNEALQWINEHIDPNKKQLVMMHHHPINVGYGIDKHGLKNKDVFWNSIKQHSSIQALACGHVHNDLTLKPEDTGYPFPLFTCPATSIQFDQTATTSACNGQGAGYRIFELFDDKKLITRTHFIASQSEATIDE